jgi:hypothetical protein
MEYWVIKADDILILIFHEGYLDKNRSHSAKPSIQTFHYSNSPWCLVKAKPMISGLPKGPGFQC